jgi:hypothetical protein
VILVDAASTTGDAPVTVTFSSRPPTLICTLTVAVKPRPTRISVRVTGVKPSSEKAIA